MKRMVWDRLGIAERAEALRRPSRAIAARARADVAAIFDDVRSRGDEALRDLTERLDGARLADLRAGAAELLSAEGALTAPVRLAVADAASRIDRFHREALAPEVSVETAPGMVCERITRPIRRVGLYVPAGTAPLPSTALMLAVPARVAGCRDVVMCTPPRPDGSADPAVLFAALTCGVTRVLKLGGAQAIAAMALGTESVPACDKLFGPGNAWVAEAKRQAALLDDGPAIDLPAGPSELLVIADSGADPVFVAADLLSQAEHGPDSQVLLVSDDARLLDSVDAELETRLKRLPRGEVAARALAASRMVFVGRLDDAFDISNDYAPEHLLLAVREPRRWLGRVESAGSIFLGAWTPQALGDYCSGTNHVLPTGGAARAWSGLSVASFQKAISVQTADLAAVAAIGPTAVALARAEGLDAHARAVEVRLERRAP